MQKRKEVLCSWALACLSVYQVSGQQGNGMVKETPPHSAQGIPAPEQVADVAEEDATLHLTLSLLGGAKKRKKKARAARERGGWTRRGRDEPKLPRNWARTAHRQEDS